MDWDSYYEKFYEWATSTQIKKMSSLTSFGASAEISEVAQEYMDEKAASRLIKKAVAYGVQFTPDEIYDLSGCCDISAMNELLKSAKCTFTQEQLEDLWGSADDEVLELVARHNHVTVFADDENEAPSVEDEIDFDEPKQKEPKLGFFSKLGMALTIGSLLDKKSQSHHGHCTGDCANCPPHYGYRYGRWYYGHDHTHGCEFGGNKGGGGL